MQLSVLCADMMGKLSLNASHFTVLILQTASPIDECNEAIVVKKQLA